MEVDCTGWLVVYANKAEPAVFIRGTEESLRQRLGVRNPQRNQGSAHREKLGAGGREHHRTHLAAAGCVPSLLSIGMLSSLLPPAAAAAAPSG